MAVMAAAPALLNPLFAELLPSPFQLRWSPSTPANPSRALPLPFLHPSLAPNPDRAAVRHGPWCSRSRPLRGPFSAGMGAPPSPDRSGGSGAARGGRSRPDSSPERSALPLPQLTVGRGREEEEKRGEREVDKVGPARQPPSRRPRVDPGTLTWISGGVIH